MKDNAHPQNLASMKPPKFNPENECAHYSSNNTSFVISNKKSFILPNWKNKEAMTILSNIPNSVLLASDSKLSEGSLDPMNIVKAGMNVITRVSCLQSKTQKFLVNFLTWT